MKHKHAVMLLGITLPICILLRTLQMCFIIDDKTGFVKQQYSAIGLAITIIICAATAAVGLFAATLEGTKHNKQELRPAIAIASVLAGGMFVYETVAVASQQTSGAWYDVLLTFLAFASAIVFVAYGLKNIYSYKMPTIILVVPVLYYIVRLISVFVSTSSLALVTENVFLIFTSSILLWFMFEFACFENNIGDSEKRPKKLFASGLAVVVLCGTTSISKFIYAMVSDVQLSGEDIAAASLNVAVGLFVLVYIVCNFGTNLDRKKDTSKHSA